MRACLCESVCVCVCVYLSTLMATLAVMCLMEDKQHSLRQAFTAKHFPQHHHAECDGWRTLSPPHPPVPRISLNTQLAVHTHAKTHTHTHTYTHTHTSIYRESRFGSSVSKLPLSSLNKVCTHGLDDESRR